MDEVQAVHILSRAIESATEDGGGSWITMLGMVLFFFWRWWVSIKDHLCKLVPDLVNILVSLATSVERFSKHGFRFKVFLVEGKRAEHAFDVEDEVDADTDEGESSFVA